MIEWNEQRLEELVRKMGVQRTPGQEKAPIQLSLYRSPFGPEPLLMQIMRLDADQWSALGYTETDRVSLVRCLGSLGCRTDDVLLVAAEYQQPLSLELAKLLIDAGAFDEEALRCAAECQQPLSLELAKLLVDAGCDPTEQDRDGWDSFVCLADGSHLVDPQATDLFLSAGCRTDLDGCRLVDDEHRIRFDQILKEHAEWKEKQDHLLAENSPANVFYGPDWGR